MVRRSLLVYLFVVMSSLVPTTANASSMAPSALEPISTVTVAPAYGFYTPPIRVRLSETERRIISKLQRQSLTFTPAEPITDRPLRWHIEPSARKSQTLALARRVLFAARTMAAWNGIVVPRTVDIIVGRSQSYIAARVAELGCDPDLAKSAGRFVMGATLCKGTIVVINLTGYLFIRQIDQTITRYMETVAEPAISATWYLIADRNMRSLAHEWIHVSRFAPSSPRTSLNEPAWLREGMAETISGMAAVRATGGRVSYLEHHVISVRKFSRWTERCTKPLREYRGESAKLGGCEYYAGAAAASLLLADYGGIGRVIEWYRATDEIGDWVTAFAVVYGMTLDEFEIKADRYIAQLRSLST